MGRNPIDITGQRFGALVAQAPTARGHGSSVVWRCICDCGNTREAAAGPLRQERVRSCGCGKIPRRPRRPAFAGEPAFGAALRYEAGESAAAIASDCGVSKNTILAAVRRAGLSVRRPGRPSS